MRHSGTITGARLQKLIAAYKAYGVFQISKEKALALKADNLLPTRQDLDKITYTGNISADNSDLRNLGYPVESVPLGIIDGRRRTAFYVAEPQLEMEWI
jgi:hypothetical protein